MNSFGHLCTMKGMIEFAKDRTAVLIKRGLAFDSGIKDIVAAAYIAGMADAIEVQLETKVLDG